MAALVMLRVGWGISSSRSKAIRSEELQETDNYKQRTEIKRVQEERLGQGYVGNHDGAAAIESEFGSDLEIFTEVENCWRRDDKGDVKQL